MIKTILFTYLAGFALAFLVVLWWIKYRDRKKLAPVSFKVALIMALMSWFTVYLFIISFKPSKR